ncbi:TrkH family potassium uptake protein [Adhaeribacter aquaticus]|uniref:TrkH family potassium uptake protein n=1 Tax=Adhaeribacter aquaticus TaxID=299567 RepID=UPI000407A34E|nr:potassium transporter TrkG [Adhaeribacter aquaticus]
MLKRFNKGKSLNYLEENRSRLLHYIHNILFYLSLGGLAFVFFDVGFVHDPENKPFFSAFYDYYTLGILVVLLVRLFLINRASIRKGWFIGEVIVVLWLTAGFVSQLFSHILPAASTLGAAYLRHNILTTGIIFYIFLIELSRRSAFLYQTKFSPTLLFIGSFILLIFLGTGLLMLPRATVGGISSLDALFTAASAVCVTGLIVVDTATYFTTFGKVIILILIQLGGLGIMTFTSFLGLFFQKRSTFQSQLFFQNLVNEENLGQTMHTLVNIIKITLLIEATGALFVFLSISPEAIPDIRDRVGFSVFHSVSAFCNAGFSTLTDGLYDFNFRFAYLFQLIIIGLIIFGGLGFPVITNIIRVIKQFLLNWQRKVLYREPYRHTSHLLTVHTKIVLVTTGLLILVGAILYFMTEANSTLREHTGVGKVVSALFGSVTPRTAGFNTVNMAQLTVPTILIYLLLMWIGGSPASTGGGIKTTTFAVAVLNVFAIARGKERLEVYRREIKSKSVRQAFAVMLLSFLVIGLATFFILYFNPEQQVIKVAFEAFSAYSTVGLSLGITAELSPMSRLVVIITMFLGRIGTFTLIAGMVTRVKSMSYRYPAESIIIT